MLVHEPVDLDDDLAVVPMGCLGYGKSVDGGSFVLKGDVPSFIREGRFQESHVHLGDIVQKTLCPFGIDRVVDKIHLGAFVQLIRPDARVDEQIETRGGKERIRAPGRCPDHMRHNAPGEVVALELVFYNCPTGTLQAAEKAHDDPVHSALAYIALHIAVFVPVAEAERTVDRQMSGTTLCAEAGGQRLVQFDGGGHGGEGVDPDGAAVLHQGNRFLHGNDLVHVILLCLGSLENGIRQCVACAGDVIFPVHAG